ncbi:hypothetical protein A6A07_16160 [Streptomyces sp. CB03911]|nr:hypothetical protein A6A07_16160 [Streptomyces sp. CB03911]
MRTVREDENRCGPSRRTPIRYTLTGTEHGSALGSCAEAAGLFGEPPCGTCAGPGSTSSGTGAVGAPTAGRRPAILARGGMHVTLA